MLLCDAARDRTALTVLSEGRAHRGFGLGVCVGVLLAGVVYLVGLAGYLLAVAW